MDNQKTTAPLSKMLLLFIVLLLCLVPLLTQSASTLAYGAPLGDSDGDLTANLHFPQSFTQPSPTGLSIDAITNSGMAPVKQVSFNLSTTSEALSITKASLEISRLEPFSWSGYYWETTSVNVRTGQESLSGSHFFAPPETATHQSYTLPLPALPPTESLIQLRITPAQASGASWGQFEAGNRWSIHFNVEEQNTATFSAPSLAVEGRLYYEKNGGELSSAYYVQDFLPLEKPPAPAPTHTLTLNPNGGAGRHEPLTGSAGDLLSPPPVSAFTREGYFFTRWTIDQGGLHPFDFSVPLGSSPVNFQLYAQWSLTDPLLITLIFERDWGSYVAPQYVKIGELATKPLDPERKGHTFTRWTTDAEGLLPWDFAVDTLPPNLKELVLYPQWTLDPNALFYVHFQANDGTPTPPSLLLPPGSILPRIHPPSKYYNDFTGWYKDHTLTQSWIPYSDTTPPHDVYLYAGWTTKDKGSSTTDHSPNLPTWTDGVWGAAKDLMTQHTQDRESWVLYEGNLSKPVATETAQDHIVLMMKEQFKMPRSVLDLLSTQKGRKLQVHVGKGYQWHFSADSPWHELDYKEYNLQVEDSTHPAISRLVGDNLAHQFRIHHLGSWPLRPYLSVQLPSTFQEKKLHLYSYNPYSNRLEYVSALVALQDGWFLMPLPPSGGSAVGEYVVTTALFKDAIVLPTNPETGGQPLSYLLSYGRPLPDKSSDLTQQVLPLTITSRQIGLFILALLTIINGVALIRLQLKRRKI